MKILNLKWKNIFSYGDDITMIDFGDEAKLWQLSGKSGSGKTSLLSIPKLLLFGKTEGSDGKTINVTDIANRNNKKGWIQGTIKTGNDLYVIERTFSPSGLKLFKNGEEVDRANMKDIQDIIETDVIEGIPYHIFSNVMSLSLNNFKSFISMTPADKRAIIDKIFSLEIINKVYELVKKDMRDLGEKINSSNSQIYTLEQMISTSTAELEALKTGVTDPTDKLSDLRAKMEKVSDLYRSQSEMYREHYSKWTELSSAENVINQDILQTRNLLSSIEQKISLFKMDRCPTCGTPFNSSDFDHIREELENEQSSVSDELEKKIADVNVVSKSKNDYAELLNKLNENILKIKEKSDQLLVEYRTIGGVAKGTAEASSIQNIIDRTEESKRLLQESISESNEHMELLNVMESMYSVDGIKQTMMNNYIPTLNEEIAETLSALGFPYSLEFDSYFDAHLQDITGEIKPQSLSTGEHKKVDITVLCAILKMLKRKYPQLNLVCLDETVSSLDYESSTEVIKYLKDISKKMQLNIFIVSHTSLDEDLFDTHLSVDKPYGFSVLDVLK